MCLASVITNLGMTLIHNQRYRCTLPSLCPLASPSLPSPSFAAPFAAPLVPAPHLRAPAPPRPFRADRGCNKVSQPPPFPRPPHLPTPPLRRPPPPAPLVWPPPLRPPTCRASRFLPRPFRANEDAKELVCTPFRSCAVTSPRGFSPPH